ncbi:MAG: alanine racemase [Actinomycetota bacterium]
MSTDTRWAWVEIDVDAIEYNVRRLRAMVSPAAVWAVVKADGYGHGAVDVARAAIRGGAEGLCVALVAEGIELRRAGIDVPILLLSEQPVETASRIIEFRLTPTVYSRPFLDALVAARPNGLPIHLKIDTGMQRVGAHPHSVPSLLASIAERAPAVRLAGVYTHLAVADEPDHEFTDVQLERFEAALVHVPTGVRVHAANSAGAIAHPAARRDLVRPGIAIYGITPGPGVDRLVADLRPALELRARVGYVKQVAAGSRISYGLRHTFSHDTTVATVPLGYADGVPRRLAAVGGQVLVHGVRRPIVGVITMDQLMVDCGDLPVAVGDEVVLIGGSRDVAGDRPIRAEEWAQLLDTIGYEIVCGISARVPRVPRRSIDG